MGTEKSDESGAGGKTVTDSSIGRSCWITSRHLDLSCEHLR